MDREQAPLVTRRKLIVGLGLGSLVTLGAPGPAAACFWKRRVRYSCSSYSACADGPTIVSSDLCNKQINVGTSYYVTIWGSNLYANSTNIIPSITETSQPVIWGPYSIVNSTPASGNTPDSLTFLAGTAHAWSRGRRAPGLYSLGSIIISVKLIDRPWCSGSLSCNVTYTNL